MKKRQEGCYGIYSRTQGSITLFLALILAMVFSLIFSLLEAARVQGLWYLAQRSMILESESALGEYQTDLWEDYRLLFLDGGNPQGKLDLALLEGKRMERSVLENKSAGFYQLALRSMEILEYSLATDEEGAAFKRQACKAIQEQLAAGAADILRQKFGAGEKMAEQGQELDRQWESAKNALTEAEELKEEQEKESQEKKDGTKMISKKKTVESSENNSSPAVSQKLPENPMESVDLLKTSAILSLVVENPAEISGKSISLQETLGQRELSCGNGALPEINIADKFWLRQYLNYYFSCGSGPGEGGSKAHALDYELEYCVAGKASDQENLEKTVNKLLLIREAGNFATISKDGKKQALAMEIATAAVGFTGIPPLVQAVKVGILLAWSYIESILDVRCLLSGGKVPLIKKVSDWKSDVSVGEEFLKNKEEKAESREDGFDYRDYLQLLLYLTKEETLTYRAMDMIEQNIRQKESAFRMDHQLHGITLEGLYSAKPLFLGFVPGTEKKKGTYHFRASHSDSYLESSF